MKARITVLTIGVDDLERSVRFYRDGLGLPTEGIIGTQFEHGAVAFFELHGGFKLAAWARDNLARDSGLAKSPHGPTGLDRPQCGKRTGSRCCYGAGHESRCADC